MQEYNESLNEREYDINYNLKEGGYNTVDEYAHPKKTSSAPTKKINIKATLKKITLMLSSFAIIGVSASGNTAVTFKEEAVEYAVKDYLNIEQSKNLTSEDLKKINDFKILGESIYIINGKSGTIKATSKATKDVFMYDGNLYPHGDIESLEDFKLFPNLKNYEVKYNINSTENGE